VSALETIEIKPLLPALNFERAQRFYQALGFTCEWRTKASACLRLGKVAFILHTDYMAVVAANTVMVLEVVDVAAWWAHVHELHLADVYDLTLSPVVDVGAGRREFTLTDPSGVLWRIGGSFSVA
jgi:hypothetical protein